MPKRGLNVNECEVARAYKVGTTLIEPISFTVPRKVIRIHRYIHTYLLQHQSEAFQSDIFPPCFSDEPALTADEWFEGKDADPKLVDLEAGFIAKAKKEFVPTAAPVEKIKSEMSSPVKEKNVSWIQSMCK